MKILFIHQNFPGQFKHLAPELAKDPQNQVAALTMRLDVPATWEAIRVISYSLDGLQKPNGLSSLSDFEVKTVRAEACYRASRELFRSGFEPDLIVAHPAWGESLYIKEVWPKAKLFIYCEFFYRAQGLDVGFDPQQTSIDPNEMHRFSLKNINNLLHFEIADAGISPTHWQANTFPDGFRKKITVIHDGIDTQIVRPNPDASITFSGFKKLTKQNEVITFVSRDLEPYRGYHIFMRALPALLKKRPNAHVLIVGGSGTNYGPKPPKDKNWAEIFASEVRPSISDQDWSRVRFLGKIPYDQFLALLQLSSVHIYLTYPFVLSWSLLEAMSCECAVVASDTGPVREVIQDGVTGRLVPFFAVDQWVEAIDELLGNQPFREKLGKQARNYVIDHFDLRTKSVPKQLEWIKQSA